MPDDRIETLRADAAYRHQRLALYRAKAYSARPTSPQRMRELEREAQFADERLQAAIDAKE
jgi:hypothetical protein